MTKSYFTAIAFLLSLTGFSQAIVLDKTYTPTLQDKFTSYFLDKTADPGAGGASVSWDFSNLKQDSSFGNTTIEVPASRKPTYPNANLAQITSYHDTTFYQTNLDTQLINWGYFSSFLGSTSYSDGQVILPYGLTYGQMVKDSIKGKSAIKIPNGTAVVPTTRRGEVTITYDGWGSLNLPGGVSYPKVARIKSVLNGIDKPVGFTQEIASSITSYSWYAENVNYAVLNITAIATVGVNDQVVIQSGPYVPAAVMDASFTQLISLSPNPTNDFVNIQANLGAIQILSLELKDATGRTILTKAGISGTSSLDLSAINSGIYFLQITSGEKMAVKKVVKN